MSSQSLWVTARLSFMNIMWFFCNNLCALLLLCAHGFVIQQSSPSSSPPPSSSSYLLCHYHKLWKSEATIKVIFGSEQQQPGWWNNLTFDQGFDYLHHCSDDQPDDTNGQRTRERERDLTLAMAMTIAVMVDDDFLNGWLWFWSPCETVSNLLG